MMITMVQEIISAVFLILWTEFQEVELMECPGTRKFFALVESPLANGETWYVFRRNPDPSRDFS